MYDNLFHLPLIAPILLSGLSVVANLYVIITYSRMKPLFSFLAFVKWLALSDFFQNVFFIVLAIGFLTLNEDAIKGGAFEMYGFFALFLPLWFAFLTSSIIWNLFLVCYIFIHPDGDRLQYYHIVAWVSPIVIFGLLTLLGTNGVTFQINDQELCKDLWINVCFMYPITILAWITVLVVTILSVALPRSGQSFALNTIELMGSSNDEKRLEDKANRRKIIEFSISFLATFLFPTISFLVQISKSQYSTLFYWITLILLPLRGIVNFGLFIHIPSVQVFRQFPFVQSQFPMRGSSWLNVHKV